MLSQVSLLWKEVCASCNSPLHFCHAAPVHWSYHDAERQHVMTSLVPASRAMKNMSDENPSQPFIAHLPRFLLFNRLTGITQLGVITYPDTSKQLCTESFYLNQTPFRLPNLHTHTHTHPLPIYLRHQKNMCMRHQFPHLDYRGWV